jgi:hypothetical protein
MGQASGFKTRGLKWPFTWLRISVTVILIGHLDCRGHTRTGRLLGTAEFVHKLEQVTGKPLAPKRPGRNP